MNTNSDTNGQKNSSFRKEGESGGVLFTPVTFGPLTLRNRTIRSAAFESMCPGNAPSQMWA